MIGVIGYGRSGKAVSKLIESLGEAPFVSDLSQDSSDIPYASESGKHTDKLLEMDLLVVSPGVSLNIPILLKAREKGIPVIGEVEFASRYIKGRIVAITGTNGKTTTAAMTHHILEKSLDDKVLLGGNIYPGMPLSSLVMKSKEDSVTIVEVSSYQLERIKDFHPWISAIVNVSPDHLDRHEDFKEYLNAKLNIFKNQDSNDYSILNKDYPALAALNLSSKRLYFSLTEKSDIYFNGSVFVRDGKNKEVFSKDDLFMPGNAFIEDGMIAALIANIIGLDWESVRERIRSFPGVEHRMETVFKNDNMWIINNSMCTNPIAFLKSLECFPDCCVIIGGRMKVADISPIVNAVKKFAKSAVLIGESSKLISDNLKNIGFMDWVLASSMEDAVGKAISTKCDRIILSPGGSSFDWYRDFRERGDVFKKLVREIYG
ncbi:UDP-N-acetylmuramoyl-L-alanine--D-glutamate ligase [candidate division WOR-3 bacterium]|nr:UDP-N-acetylmuramoyl-L-alanine--D-glutamate ligase [candidate division WOR-3 bacterium]